MQTALQRLLLMQVDSKLLILGSALIFSAIGLLSMWLEFSLLPLLFIFLPILVYIGLKSLQLPFIVLCVICVGSYLGNLVHLVEDGLIPLSLFQVFYLSGIAIFIISRFLSANFKIYVTGIELEILLFYTVVFFHTVYSPDPAFGMFYAARMLVVSLFVYLIINSIQSFRQFNILMIVIIGAATIMGVISIRDVLINPEVAAIRVLVGFNTDRLVARGSLGQVDPNVFATFFFLPITYVISLIVSDVSKSVKTMALAALPLLLLGIISTFSRSAWVALLLIIVLVGVIYRKYRIFGYAFLFLVVAFTLVPALRESLFEVVNRFAGLFSGRVDDSNRIRILLLAWSLRTFFENYMLGIGFGGFNEAFGREHNRFETFNVVESHNEPTLIAVEMGLIGLFFYSMLVFRVLQTGWKNIKNSTDGFQKALSVSVFASLIGFAIFFQFLGETLADNNIWMLTGFTFAIYILQKKQVKPLNTG